MAGACCRSLWGRSAGWIGRRAAPETLRSRPAGYISDGEPTPRGAQFMRMSRSALSRNTTAECVPDSPNRAHAQEAVPRAWTSVGQTQLHPARCRGRWH